MSLEPCDSIRLLLRRPVLGEFDSTFFALIASELPVDSFEFVWDNCAEESPVSMPSARVSVESVFRRTEEVFVRSVTQTGVVLMNADDVARVMAIF